MASKRWRRNRRLKCGCMGYAFPHRRKSGACEHSSRADYYAALRGGASLAFAQQHLSAADLDRMFPV